MTQTNYPPLPKKRSLDDVPQDKLLMMAVKIYLVGSLVWDYAGTVLDLVSTMRPDGTKKLTRTVREIKRDYDSLRSLDLDRAHLAREAELALLFEQIHKERFNTLWLGLRSETRRYGLDPDSSALVESVQMAMTVLDALKLYASECDAFIRRYYPEAPHSILPDHFIRLAVLLPQFAGDCYDGASNTRSITARILLNEIKNIELGQ